MNNTNWHHFLFAALYIGAGVNHFRIPKFYSRMIPPYWRYPAFLNLLSGALEIIFGLMVLLPSVRWLGAIGVVILLILFLSVHVYMIQVREEKFSSIPMWGLWLRLPLQLPLIYWAYLYI